MNFLTKIKRPKRALTPTNGKERAQITSQIKHGSNAIICGCGKTLRHNSIHGGVPMQSNPRSMSDVSLIYGPPEDEITSAGTDDISNQTRLKLNHMDVTRLLGTTALS